MSSIASDLSVADRIRRLWDEQRALYALADRRGLSLVEMRRLDELRLTLRELWQREREQAGQLSRPNRDA